MSPRLSIRPRSMPNRLLGLRQYGTNRATGFPRFVITISRPVSATSSINPKHLALNSVTRVNRAPLARECIFPVSHSSTAITTLGPNSPSARDQPVRCPPVRVSSHRFRDVWLSPDGRPASNPSTLMSSSTSGQ